MTANLHFFYPFKKVSRYHTVLPIEHVYFKPMLPIQFQAFKYVGNVSFVNELHTIRENWRIILEKLK